MPKYIVEPLTTELQMRLQDRLWRDDVRKIPHHLYPTRNEVMLQQLWERTYNTLRRQIYPSDEIRAWFISTLHGDLTPCYVADPNGQWYAVLIARYNLRTRYRFAYLRYWWAADARACRAMVEAVLHAWADISFDWLKFRLGYCPPFTPTHCHPLTQPHTYLVAGRPHRPWLHKTRATLNWGTLTLQQPGDVTDDWWLQYRALLDEQERIAPGLEDWGPDYNRTMQNLRYEMEALLEEGGGVINLYEGDLLVGHISWEPAYYEEQLIDRAWHINDIIIRASHRRRGLATALHILAVSKMNLLAAPVVAGLVSAPNELSLKTSSKIGRHVVDTYVTIPKPI